MIKSKYPIKYLNIIKDLENIHSNVALILNNKKTIEDLAKE